MQLKGMSAADIDELVDGFTELMQAETTHAFDAVVKTFVSESDAVVASPMDSLSVITSSWAKSVKTKFMPFLKDVFTAAGKHVANPLGVEAPLDTSSEQVLSSVEESLQAYADNLYDAGHLAVMVGWQDGETVMAMSDRLKAVPADKAKKAHSVAQTVVTATVNGGEWEKLLAIASKYSTVTTKEWVATHDSHTRPTHEAADGQTVALNDKFVVGQAFLDFPGDPFGDLDEIVNCRCTTRYDSEILPANSTTQTSSETLSTDSAAVTIEPILASAVTNTHWDSHDHPRGKDGKFIKSGVGLPTGVFKSLVDFKKGDEFKDFTGKDKDNFMKDVTDITPEQWANLKGEDQHHIETAVSDALDAGWMGSSSAQMHIDDLGLGELDSGNEANIFDPNTPLPDAVSINAVVNDIDTAYGEGKITKAQYSSLLKMSKSGVNAADLQEVLDEDVLSSTSNVAAPSTPSVSITTGSPKPLKITHGLIHAKYTPGTTVAVDENGNKIVWNGSSYDLIGADGDPMATDIKKSKLYALLNDYHANAQWHEPGNEAVAVTHVAPLDAAPPPNPIPHPVSFPAPSAVDTALDDAFGAPSTGLASPSTASTPATAQIIDMSKWKMVGGQAGSNKGALFEAPDGKRYYVKSLKSKEHAQNEVLAAALYRAAGLNVPEVRHVGSGAPTGWNNVIASPIVPNAKSNKIGLTKPGKFQEQAQQTYAVSAWLANFDVVGLTHDNIIESDGKPHLIDVGGSMGYRAQGQKKKPGDWNEDPSGALSGLMDPSVNSQAASVFGGMTYAQQRESAKALLGITDAQIDQMVADAGLPPKQAAILKARRNAILKHYGLDTGNNSTSNAHTTTPASTPTLNAPDGVEVTAHEIVNYIGGTPDGIVVANGIDEDGDTWVVSPAPGGSVYLQVGGQDVQTLTYPQFVNQSANNNVQWTEETAYKELSPTSVTPSAVDPIAAILDAHANTPITVTTMTEPSSVNVDDIPATAKAQFYKHFKNENVSPAWSGAKIYKSMKAAQLKMSGDPQFAGLTDDQMLDILDKQHNLAKATSGTPYSAKVKDWLKTPAGAKAFKDLNPAIATPPSSIAKKTVAKKVVAKKLASSSINKPIDELAGPKGITHLTTAQQEGLFNAFKSGDANGKYLKHYAKYIFYNAVQQAKANLGTSPMQVLQAVDAQGAKNLGVPNNNSFENKVQDWLDKSSVSQVNTVYNDALLSGTGTAAKKANTVAKKIVTSGGGHVHAANKPLSEKVQAVDQTVPPFDKNKKSTDFPVISVSQAATLWEDMNNAAPQGKFTATQKASLRHYTTNAGYSNMNNYLRGHAGASQATQDHINNAQAGMRPTTRDIVLHRGQGTFTDGAGRPWKTFDQISQYVGTDFHQESFFSTSVGGHAAFGGAISMEIEVPAGTPMAYVKAFSAYGGENEMLLAANMTYKVLEVKKKGYTTVVRMRVVPNGA